MTITINPRGLEDVLQLLEDLRDNLPRYAQEICEKLGDIGYEVAATILGGHVYSGETVGSLTVEQVGEGEYVLYAESKAILFLEFGAGVIGAGHPQDGLFGMGPGTFPGQTHALDPFGWWYPTDDPNLIIRTGKNGQGWGHSNGTPAYMPFYNAGQEIIENIERVAREVFNA